MRTTLVVSCLLLAACGPPVTLVGNGDMTEIDRDVPGATGVRLGLGASLAVRIGNRASLTMVGEGNLLSSIQTDVFMGELHIAVPPNVTLIPTRPLAFVLTVPTVTHLETECPGAITAPALSTANLVLKVGSLGGISVEGLEATSLTVDIASSGDVAVGPGRVTRQDVHLRSSGSYLALDLESARAHVELSSAGDAELWATETLDVDLTSSGSVRYRGTPRVTTRDTSSGSVSPIEP